MDKQNLELSDISLPEFRHSYDDVKKCPKCLSVFISNTSCESCNYQFTYSALGLPLGEKSFYSLRENYLDSLSYISRSYSLFERKGEKFESYKRASLHRYEVLLKYFYREETTSSGSLEYDNIYYKELKDVVFELISLGVSEDLIWSKFDSLETEKGIDKINIYQQISLVMEEARFEVKLSKRPLLQKYFDYKIMGGMRVGVLLLFIVSALIMIFLSISFYEYMNIY